MISFMNLFWQIREFQHEILIGLCVLLVTYVIGVLVRNTRRKFPPGPVGLPIVGYLPFLGENAHIDLVELGKKYGDIFSLRLGSTTVIVLHGAEVIKEAFKKPEFLKRPGRGGPNSPFFSANMNLWKEQRRFVVASMKDTGLGNSQIERNVQDEIIHFVEVLESFNGKPINLQKPLSPSMSNNMYALVFGERLKYEETERKFLDKHLEDGGDFISQTSKYKHLPLLKQIPFTLRSLQMKRAETAYKNLKEYVCHQVEKHKSTLDPRNIRNFIDSYFVEMRNRELKDPKTTFSESTLVATVMDLFDAGSETVPTAILWCIYIIASYPDAQKKVQQEILNVIGWNRTPNFLDQKDMPYTHAVLLEMMRWKTIVPLNLFRCPLEDTTLCGYNIPKGSQVLANFWNAHHDPRYWTEPEKFKPERFLNAEGTSVVRSSNFMAFSFDFFSIGSFRSRNRNFRAYQLKSIWANGKKSLPRRNNG